MKQRNNLSAISLALTLALFTQISPGGPTTSSTGPVWGETVAGCRMRIVSIGDSFEAGDAIDIQLEVENIGKEAVNYVETFHHPHDNFAVDIKSGSRGFVQETLYTKETEVPHVGSSIIKTLKPKGRISAKIRLNRLYDLSMADTYWVTLAFNVIGEENGHGKLYAVSVPTFKVKVTGGEWRVTGDD